ncbi:MAG: major capsid protein [Microviridae sp.]|nr:MAG: major capsid protein [Microviridae sp.]
MKKTLGGDRLGSGSRQTVELHNYERSTHDMGYLWRSTMAAGTLVPFICEVALPGDTFDIKLNADIKTLPTIGPLFGSYKLQLDVFLAPMRLYQGKLHNNKLGIGLKMADIKLPLITLNANEIGAEEIVDKDNAQINPSCLLSYLGIRGVGDPGAATQTRKFNGIPLLAYWEIYKNYYANKQEELGAVIHSPLVTTNETVDEVTVDSISLPQAPATNPAIVGDGSQIIIDYSGTAPQVHDILFLTATGQSVPGDLIGDIVSDDGSMIILAYNFAKYGANTLSNWRYATAADVQPTAPIVTTFDLNNIDKAREDILSDTNSPTAFDVNGLGYAPYSLLLNAAAGKTPYMQTQEGLALKTYQSDLFNNWLSTEWIDGAGGINEITSIDTTGGSFTIDTLNLSKKVYDMLNRIAVSGGSYDDWIDAVYTETRHTRAESPMYMGGLIKEVIFQEVISNSQSQGTDGTAPLGTLAGRGTLAHKHKGGDITIKVDEPAYVIGIVSLTPRIDYSQGNKWDTSLLTMDDLHKPALDEIGFQELIQEQMAYWTTAWDGFKWVKKSAGKQPAWINYMTNVNQTRGNFAIISDSMFMTLNRRYEYEAGGDIKDLTTYIDPTKFNQIFAQTSIDAQNFWAQIAVDMTARRKMSAKLMPNL